MASTSLRREEGIALILVLAAHTGLLAWLALKPPAPAPLPPPERVSVTLAEETAPEATTPDPSHDPAAAGAPELGLTPPSPQPSIEPVPPPSPAPHSTAAAVVPPKPAKPAAKPAQEPVKPGKPGSSSFADAFQTGVPGGSGKGNPDAKASAQQQSAIRVSINQQVVRPWNACSVTGLDTDKLRARVEFTLDRDGSLTSIGDPLVSGITPSNSPQAKRFGECAVRAVRTAAPFRLPPEYYDFWKNYRLNFQKQGF